MENKESKQAPIGSGFGAASTAAEVIKGINLNGKVAIVTGGYAGIGLETAKSLANAGATVIVPARNAEKAALALSGIENIETEYMDLMNPDSINGFAQKFLSSGRPVHLLINNAGIMWVPLQRDARGYESQFSTNHLGHFQLTALLWPALKKADGARVVNVSSWGHRFSPVIFDDPHFLQREFETLQGYGQSKTANILFTLELDYRGKSDGVRSFSLHPGAIVETDLKRHLTTEQLINIGVYDAEGKTILNPDMGMKTIEQGASTTVWCATSPKLDGLGGLYCEDTEVAVLHHNDEHVTELTSMDLPKGVMPYAVDKQSAEKLWTLSENLIGLSFHID
ncbi:SDR family NAD(P)-dependent oxidoreductase [Pedobacter frigidisoli]|uniref:SDR family NAD(P)-dependent oxidoreductase n=1 Tax=Pedobacter frigidisoli TaxID=2530455 RepID=UPI00292F8E21|nr:SDR family NAD(P)-dependent oxidoreductase [Pedobacter frigidisoli]